MARTVLAVDVGSSGVRAAEFTVGRRTPRLRRFASAPLPSGAVEHGLVKDPEALTEALRSLRAQGKFDTRKAILGLANDNVLVRQMDLDQMAPRDFRKSLQYQVAEALPMPVDEVNLDYYLLEERTEKGEDGADRQVARVLLVAAVREMVDGFVSAAEAAGLRVVGVDLVPFALVRASSPVGAEDDVPEALVDVGADLLTVVVHRGGRPRSVRMISGLGGDTLTRALQERYEWSWEDAERTKVVLGLEPEESAGEELADHPARSAIREQADLLVAEVKATLEFFGDLGKEDPDAPAPLSRVLLTGRGARLRGLPALMSDGLGVPVEYLDPFGRVKARRRMRDPEQQASLAVCAGLGVEAVTR